MAENEVTIEFEYPFMLDKDEVKSITIRRPIMDDIIQSGIKDFADHRQLCRLVARISNLGLPALSMVDYFTDFGRIADAIAAFSPAKK